MSRSSWASSVLLIAVLLNVGWLWVPVGLLALAVACWGTHLMVRDRWSAWLEALILAVVWIPLLYVVIASGLTVGTGEGQLFSIGGGENLDTVRAASGLVIPLLVAGQLAAWRPGLVRKLALASLVLWLVAGPLTLFVGERLGPDIDEIEDPEDVEAPGTLVELLVVVPFLAAYGLAVGAAGVASWEDHHDDQVAAT